MKSQDVLLLLKLASISAAQKKLEANSGLSDGWQDWELPAGSDAQFVHEPKGADWLVLIGRRYCRQ